MNREVYTNALIREASPYLQQHAHNPVDWYPWSNDVLSQAISMDKLIIVSIGYSSCHWCHVMEKECFNDEEVALMMNQNFVSIKVDKEERPDVDQQYMAAVRLMTGTGGWPLNVVCLPDGRPIYGGTYFPRFQWLEILERLSFLYRRNKKDLVKIANELEAGVKSVDLVECKYPRIEYLPKYLKIIVESWKRKFDSEWGGTQSSPKFPMPSSIDFLLSYAYHMRDEEVKQQALLTLDKMMDGGIYDQIGGGFHRYSVDSRWFLPHFEKMLYDNAQLGLTYCYAYQFTKEEKYKRVAKDTIEYLLRDFLSPEKLFYTSMDADSEEGEGGYYMWTYDEVRSILDDDTSLFCDRFGITPGGNLGSGKNILAIHHPIKYLTIKYDKSEKEVNAILSLSLKKLFCGRFLREKPAIDSKVILGWNALAVKMLAYASAVLEEPRYLVAAIDGILKIEEKYIGGNSVYRTISDNQSRTDGVLEDYAFLVEAYIALYQVTFDFSYIEKANSIVALAFEKFYDEHSGMFFYTEKKIELPLGRKMDMVDGVMPSSNSSLARSLHYLSIAMDRSDYRDVAVQMLANMQEQMFGAGPYISNWGMLLINLTFAPAEVTFVGENALVDKRKLDRDYLPNVLFFGSKVKSEAPIFRNRWRDHKTSIYLCIANVCRNFDGGVADIKESALEVRNCYIL